ncbi:hypothetical protein MW887_002490 [Aspergillus wentii]|nr:hypothetical protein MW887_002490 [Aspergillus wentii]
MAPFSIFIQQQVLEMEKCWFVLRQHHYPPPPRDGHGPIRLGNVIPNLRELDQVINVDGPEPFPANMPVYSTKKCDLKWDDGRERELSGDLGVGVPIPTAPGLTVGPSVGVAFERSVNNHWEFESLDSHIIQPTASYIRDSVDNEFVQDYVVKRAKIINKWSLFMITGLIIAKGARGFRQDSKETNAHGGPEVSMAGILNANADIGVGKTKDTTLSYEASSDFIWAIRLTKISKRLFSSQLGYKSHIKGATLAAGEEDEYLSDVLTSVDLQEDNVQSFSDDTETFAISPDL